MQIHDYVTYGVEGICEVSDIVCPDFVKDKSKKFYVLIPVNDKTSKVYLPVDTADTKCRKLLSESKATELINNIENIETASISNDKEREHIYREALQTGDLIKIISILKNIYARRKQRFETGRKNTAVDEKYYKIADRHLCRELGFILHLSDTEVREKLLQNTK